MSALRPNQAFVADNVLLDGRLALFHQRERWLAVADLHFGYEISQRAAGGLAPMWGMETVWKRLSALLDEYKPARLVIVGDFVHDAAAKNTAREFLGALAKVCETIVLCGNHDRHLAGTVEMVASWRTDEFHFHHGHCQVEAEGKIQIIGHHHPAGVLRDGAGLRLKYPAFVQQETCWILPAFSPWASGAEWKAETPSRLWLCTPQRVLRVPDLEPASAS